MRKTISHLTAAALLFGAAPLFADTQADLTARYAALKAAMDDREDKPIKAFLTKDFHATDLQGEVHNADEMIAGLAMIPDDPAMKSETTILGVAVDGATAKVSQKRDTNMSRQGRDGATHAIEMISQSDDVWVQSKGVWLLQSTETQDMTFKRDGVEMRHFHKGDPMPPRRPRGEGGPRGEGPPPGPPPAGN